MLEIAPEGDLKTALRKNRNRFQITQAILQIAREGSRKTRIMHGANLSFKLLEKYLTTLVRAGLLKVKEVERKTYVTSEKGLRFLKEFEALEKHVAMATAKKDRLDRMLTKAKR